MAKTYLQAHPDASVALFDSAQTIGGVWAHERLYPGLRTNNLWTAFEFSDFPMTKYGLQEGQHIPGTVVHEYLKDFADHFQLTQHIFLKTTIIRAAFHGCKNWIIRLQDATGQRDVRARRLVVATGLESQPALPSLPGMEEFNRPLFHTKEWPNHKNETDGSNTVTVFGGSKSAADVANYCAGRGAKVHWVIRQSGSGPGWTTPTRLTGFNIRLDKLVAVRFLALFSPCIWTVDGYIGIRSFLQRTWLGRMIIRKFYADMEKDICNRLGYAKHPETQKLRPWTPIFWHGADVAVNNYEEDIMAQVRSGQIQIHIADVDCFTAGTVHLSNGVEIQTDAFVCATGWKFKPSLSFVGVSDEELGLPLNQVSAPDIQREVDEEIYEKFPILRDQPIRNSDSRELRGIPAQPAEPYRLYRFTVPPSLAHTRSIAFAGALHNVMTCMTAQTQALWITAYFDDRIDNLHFSDDADKIQQELKTIKYETFLHTQFSKRRTPFGMTARHPAFSTDSLAFVDLLLKDLGLDFRRNRNWYKRLFQAYTAKDYVGLVDEWLEGKGKQKIE